MNAGNTPLDISEATAVAASLATRQIGFGRKEKVKHDDLLMFSRQIYTLLKAGIPLTRALAGLQESAAPAMGEVIRHTRESLESGNEMSTSLARQTGVFSGFYVAMVRVGEMTGRLDEVFLRLFHHLEFEKLMRDQVKSALRYPSFVVAVMGVAVMVVNIFVIPAFQKVFDGFGAELPFMTQILVGFSKFTLAAWPYLLAGTVGGFFAFKRWTSTENGRYVWDRSKLKFPIAGKIIRKATLARFSRSFALALKSGVPVVQAMMVVANTVENAFFARAIEKMRDGVERGDSLLRTAAASAIFTPVVLQMIAVGEESGTLDEMLGEVADFYQQDVEYELKSLSAQIEPILIIFLGVLVLILALGVFLPIWDLGKAAVK
jgi:MSHA biogenesis protein MshG